MFDSIMTWKVRKGCKFYYVHAAMIIKFIYTRNLQILATEMFDLYRNISPPIFNGIFLQRNINYNLQSNPVFAAINVR